MHGAILIAKHYFVGLGNPGRKYCDTRHNIGFAVLDTLARALSPQSTPYWESGKRGLFALFRYNSPSCCFLLVKPNTFMNNSGLVLPHLARAGIPLEEILVVYDNLDLALGAIKLKQSGSSGGHNGLASIIHTLGAKFMRIGIGIGRPQYRGEVERYVLSRPRTDEQETLTQAVERVCASYLEHPAHSFSQRMEYLHRRAS